MKNLYGKPENIQIKNQADSWCGGEEYLVSQIIENSRVKYVFSSTCFLCLCMDTQHKSGTASARQNVIVFFIFL